MMKMAKASDADIDMAVELANALEALAGEWIAYMPEKIARATTECENERFDIDSHNDCRRVLDYLTGLVRRASLFRVVFGMSVLLDPRNKIVDPEAGTLEHHPDVVKALNRVSAADAINAQLLAALERTAHAAYSQTPLRDMAETLAEASTAIRAATQGQA